MRDNVCEPNDELILLLLLPFHHTKKIKKGALTTKRTTARHAAATVTVRAAKDDDEAKDSSSYRSGTDSTFLGKVVSSLPDGRKQSAPESYGDRPESKTLQEGRYRRPPPERVGGVNESTVRGEDFEVVDGPSFGIGTLIGLVVAAATLGAVYLTVTKLGEPVERKRGARMPERDSPAPTKAVAAAPAPALAAPAVALE